MYIRSHLLLKYLPSSSMSTDDSDITKERIEAQKAAGFSSTEKAGAKRSLERLAKQSCNADISKDDDEMIALFCAIRKIKQNGDPNKDVRINPSLLRSFRAEAFRTVELFDEYNVVPKSNYRAWTGNDANKRLVESCIIPPEEFLELPIGLDTETHYIMDDAAPRNLLGLRVRKLKFKAGMRRSKVLNPEASQSASSSPAARVDAPASAGAMALEDSSAPASVAGAPVSAKREADGPAEGDNWEKRARKLFRKPSDEAQALRKTMEGICSEIVSEFQKENYVQPDRMRRSAELWFRKFHENLAAQWKDWRTLHSGEDLASCQQSFYDNADPFSKGLPGFVVQNLLEKPTYAVLPAFSTTLKAIQSELSNFVDAMTDVLLQLCDLPLESDQSVDTSRLEVQQLKEWQTSALLEDFLTQRAQKKFEIAQADTSSDHDTRLKAVNALRGGHVSDEMGASLDVARTFFGNLSKAEKSKYLIKESARFDMLAHWVPGHKVLDLKPCSVKENAFKPYPATRMVEALFGIVAHDDCISMVANPIAKDLLKTFQKLLRTTDGGETISFAADVATFQLVRALCAELLHVKLGCALDVAADGFVDFALPPQLAAPLIKNVDKVLGSNLKKLPGPASRWVAAEGDKMTKPATKAEEKLSPEKAAPSPPAPGAEVADAGGKNASTEALPLAAADGKMADAGGKEASTEASPLTTNASQHLGGKVPGKFDVGDKVVVSSGTNKDKYDKKLGEIVKGGGRPLVKLLDGPVAGSTKEFSKDKLKHKTHEKDVSDGSPLVPAAGTGHELVSASRAAGQDDAAAKRAAALFGQPAKR